MILTYGLLSLVWGPLQREQVVPGAVLPDLVAKLPTLPTSRVRTRVYTQHTAPGLASADETYHRCHTLAERMRRLTENKDHIAMWNRLNGEED